MLDYAGAFGVTRAAWSGTQLRELLLSRRCTRRPGLAGAYAGIVRQLRLEPAERYQAFPDGAGAGCRERCLPPSNSCSLSRRSSSQLIDNLNASMHLSHPLLTDIFLIDELVKLRQHLLNELRLNDAGKLA